jgi:hypothetical protein
MSKISYQMRGPPLKGRYCQLPHVRNTPFKPPTSIVPWPERLPSFRFEFFSIFSIKVLSPVHHIYLIVHLLACFDEYRGFAI